VKTILATFLILLFLIPVSAIGEIQTITHTVKQPFGGSQSPDDARIAAVAKAKREALEMAGTYIESLTVVKNSQVDKDEILALAAGVLKAEVVSQKNYVSGDAFGIEVVVNLVVDTSILEERVKKLLQDRTHLEQLNQSRAREKELLEKIAVLEGENRKSGKSNQKKADLKKEFQDASRGLTAEDWFDKALALLVDGKYTDFKEAIEYLTNCIRLKPDAANAYYNRGTAYAKGLGQYHRAIQDYNEAIRLKPDNAEAFNNRGVAYGNLGQYHRAIQDYNEAIRLKPDNAEAFNNRGTAYGNLGQYQRAIEDFDKAFRLKPDYAMAYYNRGRAYCDLGQYQRAIEDFDKAIRLNPDYSDAFNNRGTAYKSLGQQQRAIQDYNEVIRLKPDNAAAYYNRGVAYGNLGQYQRAINDFDKAIRLKPDNADAYGNRGNAYQNLGQQQPAIEDYDEVIRLKPDHADTYNNRALSYLMQGKIDLGCRDAQKACELGKCKLLELVKGKGDCR
jgi:tetratricopeptide (TPR) repeat protein